MLGVKESRAGGVESPWCICRDSDSEGEQGEGRQWSAECLGMSKVSRREGARPAPEVELPLLRGSKGCGRGISQTGTDLLGMWPEGWVRALDQVSYTLISLTITCYIVLFSTIGDSFLALFFFLLIYILYVYVNILSVLGPFPKLWDNFLRLYSIFLIQLLSTPSHISRMDRGMDGLTDGQMDDGQMDRWLDAWMDGWIEKWIEDNIPEMNVAYGDWKMYQTINLK